MDKSTFISISDFRVYDHGSVLTHDNNTILFEFEELKIQFLFNSNSSIKGLPVNVTMSANKTMNITLTNFNSISCGIENPVKIGHLKGSALYVHFMISSLNETGAKVLHYTFLLKDE